MINWGLLLQLLRFSEASRRCLSIQHSPSNLFGDILTDIGAVVSGGMGLAPSGNIDPTMEHPSMFEPVHGSATDIVGQGVANPLATVRSGAILFDHLGETAVAETIRTAVEEHLADAAAPWTPDLGGSALTTEVTEALEEWVERGSTLSRR